MKVAYLRALFCEFDCRLIYHECMRGILVVCLLLTSSCGLNNIFRNKNNRGVDCVDSRMYPIVDLALAGVIAYGLISEGGAADAPAALAVPGVLAVTGVFGWKAGSKCRRYKRNAPPEAWDRARQRRNSRARDRAESFQRLQEMKQRNNASSGNSYESPTNSYSSSETKSSSKMTITINGKSFTGENDGVFGRTCGTKNAHFPTGCPSGYTCYMAGPVGQCVVD